MYYETYINEIKLQLSKGERVIAFFEYQLKDLKETFKDDLECHYNTIHEWWTCKLKTPVSIKSTKRLDIDVKELNKLYNKGYSINQLCELFKCSYSTIKRRLFIWNTMLL